MVQDGKLEGRAAAAVTAQPGQPGRLGLLRDTRSGVAYLVDTGAVFCVVPFSSAEPPSGPLISAADGANIPCWGRQEVEVCAGGRIFKWPFLKAAVAFPLIGTDFLVNFGLSVDLAAMRLRAAGSAAIALSSPPAGKVFATVGVQPQGAVGPHLAGRLLYFFFTSFSFTGRWPRGGRGGPLGNT